MGFLELAGIERLWSKGRYDETPLLSCRRNLLQRGPDPLESYSRPRIKRGILHLARRGHLGRAARASWQRGHSSVSLP